MTATAATAATAARPRPVNPYAKAAQNAANMGRQSQQRISNTKRKHQLCNNSSSSKKKKGDQLTLLGGVAFDSKRDCGVCKAKFLSTLIEGYRIPKRGHHPLCDRNAKTRGKGELSQAQLATLEDNKRHKALVSPIAEFEKGSSRNLPRDRGEVFFAPRMSATTPTAGKTTITAMEEEELSPSHFCKAVTKLVGDESFVAKHKNKQAPLAMMAFAQEVADKIIQRKRTGQFFNQLTVVVPHCEEAYNNPHYHSIVGQKLLCVDWERTHNLQVPCPDSSCTGSLANQRSHFSKNKTLFPVFNLQGAPHWCVIQKMACNRCRRCFDSNDGEVLVNLPDYAADAHPVDATYAGNFASHLSRNTTEVFASVLLTYGNGEMCSKLLCNSFNRAYLRRLKSHYSKWTEKKPTIQNENQVSECIKKDGEYIKTYPPLGETTRDMFDAASVSTTNPWRVSDYERHTRETQAVKCDGIFCQDHTFQLVKNYQKKVGAIAAWTCGTSTGEVAAVALVPSTKAEHFSHAATQLTMRPCFTQTHMHSDTWPSKEGFWLKKGVKGRLGLFHFQQRTIRTLRKKHTDYTQAINDLLSSMHSHHAPDCERLLNVLKDGTLSATGKKCSSDDIADLKRSRLFRDRYSRCLRKVIHEPETIKQNLDDWFCKCKLTSSDPANKPAGGRMDPVRVVALFTVDTKSAVEACKEKAKYLSDPLPLEQMYEKTLPNPNSSHQLTEFLSKRGESKLEAFHDRLAHFANSGMRERSADNLNLAGTARFNIAMRHKRRLVTTENTSNEKHLLDRKSIPAAWEKIVPCFNHCELWHVNNMAKSVGCPHPFPSAEILPKDTGERFFSQCMIQLKEIGNKQMGDAGECLCQLCRKSVNAHSGEPTTSVQPPPRQQQQQTLTVAGRNITRQAPQPAPAAATTINRHTDPNANAHIVVRPAAAPPPPTHAHLPMLAPTPPNPVLLPFWCFPPMLSTPPQWNSCCSKYKEWLMRPRRVGRPPHHPLCHSR